MPSVSVSNLRRVVVVALFGLALLLDAAAPAEALLFDADLPRATKVRNLNLLAAGTIIVWGVGNWDYFQETPQAKNEEWFSHGTEEGGADKFGHVYSAYALSHAYAWIYREWDYPEEQAMRYGALSALGTTGIMELGDSFSDYGFSYEDMLMNCVGAAAGYWLGTHPDWQQRLDLRMEYAPSLSHFEGDVFTDYEHIKYLLALKADGFLPSRDTPLRYFELHVGYYARDYDNYHPGQADDRERSVYVGIGLNVGKLIAGGWDTKLFNYLQLPYTYLPVNHSLDD
jgi:hypothetical protein